MKILETEFFKNKRDEIVRYIARDKRKAAIEFAKKLKEQINDLSNFPYKYRQSYYFLDKSYRDMVFGGYTIVYKIDEKNETIKILDIFNHDKPPVKKSENE